MKNLIRLLLFVFCITANAQTEIKKDYYPNGQLKYQIPYKNGLKNGVKGKPVILWLMLV